jgi:hypothetical protein
MFDAIWDLFRNGKPLVVEAANWRGVEVGLRKARIKFWAWQRFESSDGGDCVAVSVPAKQYKRAQEIAGMSDEKHAPWGFFGKLLIAVVILGLVGFVLMGGAP